MVNKEKIHELALDIMFDVSDEEAEDIEKDFVTLEKMLAFFDSIDTDGVEETGKYRVFHVKDTASKVTEERMRNTWYPMETVEGGDDGVKRNYFFFRFDEEVNIGKIDVGKLLLDMRAEHLKKFQSYVPGEPMFTTAEKLMEYRGK